MAKYDTCFTGMNLYVFIAMIGLKNCSKRFSVFRIPSVFFRTTGQIQHLRRISTEFEMEIERDFNALRADFHKIDFDAAMVRAKPTPKHSNARMPKKYIGNFFEEVSTPSVLRKDSLVAEDHMKNSGPC